MLEIRRVDKKNCKVMATGGLRKQWELGVKSKVESSTPSPPHLALSHWWAYWQAELSYWWAEILTGFLGEVRGR